MVVEESRDKWFSSEKPRYGSFEIIKIEIDKSGSMAMISGMVETALKVRGASYPAKIPYKASWKVEDGEWRYYLDPNAAEVKARPVRIPDPGELLGKVTASKNEIKLCGCGEPQFEVGINNDMPGDVTLSLEPVNVPGLRVSLKDTLLHAKQSTNIILEYDGAEKPPSAPVPLYVNVSPTGEQVVVKMIFATTN